MMEQTGHPRSRFFQWTRRHNTIIYYPSRGRRRVNGRLWRGTNLGAKHGWLPTETSTNSGMQATLIPCPFRYPGPLDDASIPWTIMRRPTRTA